MTVSIPTITHVIELMHVTSLERQLLLGFATDQSALSAHEKIAKAIQHGSCCVIETCTGTAAIDGKHWCAALVHDAYVMDMAWKRHKDSMKNSVG